MTFKEEPTGDSERNVALDGWVAAFDREMEQSGDIAASTAAVAAHGCFDVRAVVERWILTNPTGGAALAQVQPALQEPTAPRLLEEAPARVLVLEEVPVIVLEEAPPAVVPEDAPPVAEAGDERAPSGDAELTSRRPAAESSPDIAYFRSLLEGGIERAQIDEAFPGFRLVVDQAVDQYESGAEPILSEVPPPPTREDLNDEIRGMRQKLQESATKGRRRWRSRK